MCCMSTECYLVVGNVCFVSWWLPFGMRYGWLPSWSCSRRLLNIWFFFQIKKVGSHCWMFYVLWCCRLGLAICCAPLLFSILLLSCLQCKLPIVRLSGLVLNFNKLPVISHRSSRIAQFSKVTRCGYMAWFPLGGCFFRFCLSSISSTAW